MSTNTILTADVSSGERKARPIQAYLLLICGCMSVLVVVVIAPILPKMQAHFVTTEDVEYLVPMALTAPGLMVAILSLFVGALADRIGRKRMLIGGLTFYAAFGVAPIWLDSLHIILASRFGVGITEAIIMTCCTVLIGDYFHGLQRERYLALNTTFASTSAVIFIALGGYLGEFGWRVPFGVYGISLILVPAALLLLWEPQRHGKSVNASLATQTGEDWYPWRLVGICVVTVLGAIVFMAVQVHIAYLLEDVGVTSSSTVGLIASAAQVAVVVGSLLFRGVLRFGLRTPSRIGLASSVIALGFLVIGFATNFLGVTTGALVTGIGCGLLLPTLLCWNMGQLSQRHRALGTGAWMAAFFLGQFLTPLVIVGLSEQVGGFAAAIKTLGIGLLPCALGLFAFAWWVRNNKLTKSQQLP
jgi:MFS family permease